MQRSKALVATLATLFLAFFAVAQLAAEEDEDSSDEVCELRVANGTSHSFQIFIDGQKAGKVDAGKELVIEGLDYGPHELIARTVDKRVKAETKVTIKSPRYRWRLTGDDEGSDEDPDEDSEADSDSEDDMDEDE